MASTIDTSGIDETKPVASVPTTASVRANFSAIKTELGHAKTDIEALQVSGSWTSPSTVTVSSSSAAITITQTGAGNALVVEDSTSPDSSPVVINGDGKLLVGNTTAFSHSTSKFQVTDSPIRALAANDTAANSAALAIDRARGTVSSPTIISSGDTIGKLDFYGYDGASFLLSAQVAAFVDGATGTNDMPGRLVFSTTADGASSPTERMRITSAGYVGIGSTAPTALLTVSSAAPRIDITETGAATTHRISTLVRSSDSLSFQTRDSTGTLVSDDYTMIVGSTGVIRHLFNITDSAKFTINSGGDVVVGDAALATTATEGFPWIPSCAGAPTGAPTAPYTNAAALVADTTNTRLYVLIGATWRYAALT